MFIENKYNKWYNKLINSAKSRIPPIIKEKHHILPKSLGGSNSKENLVNLTPREHYICHLLLTKFTIGDARKKMFYALHRITNKSEVRIKSSRIYEYLRINHCASVSERCKGKTILELYGKSHAHDISDYQKQQIAKSNSERIWTNESRQKLSKSQKLRKQLRPESFNPGISKSDEHKKNLSISKINKFKQSDKEIYHWSHAIHGSFIGTRSQLKDNFPQQNLKISEISKIINPKYSEKSYKGWKLN